MSSNLFGKVVAFLLFLAVTKLSKKKILHDKGFTWQYYGILNGTYD